MSVPDQAVTLTAEQIRQLSTRLAELRHNVNNQVSLIVAATELIRRKPEMVQRFMKSLEESPQRITQEVKSFSDQLEGVLRITRP